MRPQPLIMVMVGDIVADVGEGPDSQARRIGFGSVTAAKVMGGEILGEHAAHVGITRAREGRRNIGPLPLPGAMEQGGVAGSGFAADQAHHEMSRSVRPSKPESVCREGRDGPAPGHFYTSAAFEWESANRTRRAGIRLPLAETSRGSARRA